MPRCRTRDGRARPWVSSRPRTSPAATRPARGRRERKGRAAAERDDRQAPPARPARGPVPRHGPEPAPDVAGVDAVPHAAVHVAEDASGQGGVEELCAVGEGHGRRHSQSTPRSRATTRHRQAAHTVVTSPTTAPTSSTRRSTCAQPVDERAGAEPPHEHRRGPPRRAGPAPRQSSASRAPGSSSRPVSTVSAGRAAGTSADLPKRPTAAVPPTSLTAVRRSAAAAERQAERRGSVSQARSAARQRRRVARPARAARAPAVGEAAERLGQPAHVGGQHRDAAGERLDHDDPEALGAASASTSRSAAAYARPSATPSRGRPARPAATRAAAVTRDLRASQARGPGPDARARPVQVGEPAERVQEDVDGPWPA